MLVPIVAAVGAAPADAAPDVGRAQHRQDQVQGLRPRRPPDRAPRLEGLLRQGRARFIHPFNTRRVVRSTSCALCSSLWPLIENNVCFEFRFRSVLGYIGGPFPFQRR